MFTGKELAAYCETMYANKAHWAYWYGTYGNVCTMKKYESKKKQYPDHYGSSRTKGYMKDIEQGRRCADCVGMIKSFFWTGNKYDTDPKYGSNGCPDKSANGMFSYCKSKGMDWGAIGTLPEIVGLALFTDGHIGYYVGGGYAVEWRGFKYGCVKTRVKDRTWKHWAKLPFINYDGADAVPTKTTAYALGDRLLKKGSSGDDVKALQQLLGQLGYDLAVDGDFGSATEAAVIAFQRKSGLEQDGKYGDLTHAALMAAVADDDLDWRQEPETEPAQPAGKRVKVVCESGTVNIRSGNGTGYARLTAAPNGTLFEYVATAANGWHAVKAGSQVGWISGEYSDIV